MVKDVLKQLKEVYAYPSVTLSLATHRDHPENRQDPIALKALVKEAEERLAEEFPDRDIADVLKNLAEAAAAVDHDQNLEGLVLFAGENTCEVVRLPFTVESRVTIDHTFATRDLFRALNQSTTYFVLLIAKDEARLYEGYSGRLVQELKGNGFPARQSFFHEGDRAKKSKGHDEDQVFKSFFNQVDKQLNQRLHKAVGKVVIASTERNYHLYREVADNPARILGHIRVNRDEANPHELAANAWELVEGDIRTDAREAEALLDRAESEQKIVSGIPEIWDLINQGRGDVLLVEEDFFQPARYTDSGSIELADDARASDVIDDVVDEMIEIHASMKGKVLFVAPGTLAKYERIVLITRY